MTGKKILMLSGEFTEEYEIYVFQKGMEAVGHTVHVVCPDKKAGDRIKTSLHDFEGDQTYTEKLGHYADINKTFSEVRPEEYDAVYAAGGRGPEYIRTDKRVQDMVRHFHDTGKPIFTICHGVQFPHGCAWRAEGPQGRRPWRLRARGDSCWWDLHGRGAHRGLCRRQHGLGEGVDGPCRIHARVPERARHEDHPHVMD